MPRFNNRQESGNGTNFSLTEGLLGDGMRYSTWKPRPGFFTPFAVNNPETGVSRAVYNTFGATIVDVRDLAVKFLDLCQMAIHIPKRLIDGNFAGAYRAAANGVEDVASMVWNAPMIAFNFAYELIAFITRTIATLLTGALSLAGAVAAVPMNALDRVGKILFPASEAGRLDNDTDSVAPSI